MKMSALNIIQGCPFMVTSQHISIMVQYFEARGEKWYLLLLLVGWHFLLRMMSERFPWKKGELRNAQGMVQEGLPPVC